MNLAYWEDRVSNQGLNAVSTVGDVANRTEEEIDFLTSAILRVYPDPVDLAIDFGAGCGRLLPVLQMTSRRQILVDFVAQNEALCKDRYPEGDYRFVVCAAKDYPTEELADFSLTSFMLLHVIDPDEFRDTVSVIVNSVKPGGHLFIYESYNVHGIVAKHCSGRDRVQFLEPFDECKFVREVAWHSRYQPYEVTCHQPIRLFVFRRT